MPTCISCTRPASAGRTHCAECKASLGKALRRIRRDAGMCYQCGKHPPSGPTNGRCEICSEPVRARTRARRARLIEAGLCATCGRRPPREGRRECAQCAAANVASVQRSRKT